MVILSVFAILYYVNLGLSLWAGMADQRISHGNPKLTCHSRASLCVEQRAFVGQKRPLKSKYVWAIRVRLELSENHGDLALLNAAID